MLTKFYIESISKLKQTHNNITPYNKTFEIKKRGNSQDCGQYQLNFGKHTKDCKGFIQQVKLRKK